MGKGIEGAGIFLRIIDHRWIILSALTLERKLAVPESIPLGENLTHEGSDICFQCHQKEKNKMGKNPYKHKPATDGKCLDCHDSHTSSYKGHLIDKEDQLCYQCHEKEAFNMRYIHSPVGKGKCSGCHDSHSSDNKLLHR